MGETTRGSEEGIQISKKTIWSFVIVVAIVFIIWVLSDPRFDAVLNQTPILNVLLCTILIVGLSVTGSMLLADYFVKIRLFNLGKIGCFVLADTIFLGISGFIIGIITHSFFIGLPFRKEGIPGMIAFIIMSIIGAQLSANMLYSLGMYDCEKYANITEVAYCYSDKAVFSSNVSECDNIPSSFEAGTPICYANYIIEKNLTSYELCSRNGNPIQGGYCYAIIAKIKNDSSVCSIMPKPSDDTDNYCRNYLDLFEEYEKR